nr:MAG TPA: hypothetical protein [Caudoviricetes sp.]
MLHVYLATVPFYAVRADFSPRQNIEKARIQAISAQIRAFI